MGENRQRYLDKLQERLKARKKRIQDGEEVEEDEEILIDDDEAKTTGNILKDLQLRYEQEKEALLRKLQVVCSPSNFHKLIFLAFSLLFLDDLNTSQLCFYEICCLVLLNLVSLQ